MAPKKPPAVTQPVRRSTRISSRASSLAAAAAEEREKPGPAEASSKAPARAPARAPAKPGRVQKPAPRKASKRRGRTPLPKEEGESRWTAEKAIDKIERERRYIALLTPDQQGAVIAAYAEMKTRHEGRIAQLEDELEQKTAQLERAWEDGRQRSSLRRDLHREEFEKLHAAAVEPSPEGIAAAAAASLPASAQASAPASEAPEPEPAPVVARGQREPVRRSLFDRIVGTLLGPLPASRKRAAPDAPLASAEATPAQFGLSTISEGTEPEAAPMPTPTPAESGVGNGASRKRRTIAQARLSLAKREQERLAKAFPALAFPASGPAPRQSNADARAQKLGGDVEKSRLVLQQLQHDEDAKAAVARPTKRVKLDQLDSIPHNRPGESSSTFGAFDDSDDGMEVDIDFPVRSEVFSPVAPAPVSKTVDAPSQPPAAAPVSKTVDAPAAATPATFAAAAAPAATPVVAPATPATTATVAPAAAAAVADPGILPTLLAKIDTVFGGLSNVGAQQEEVPERPINVEAGIWFRNAYEHWKATDKLTKVVGVPVPPPLYAFPGTEQYTQWVATGEIRGYS